MTWVRRWEGHGGEHDMGNEVRRMWAWARRVGNEQGHGCAGV